MNPKINIHNFLRSHTFIVLVFAIMSIMSAIVMWHTKYVFVGGDLSFHWRRVFELKSDIINGNWWPIIALNRFNQNGYALMGLYPKLNLYPIVLLSFIIKHFIPLFYITFILRNFISLLIGYFSSYNFNRSKKISILFSISYTLANASLFHAIILDDMGISSSTIFLPLVLFGSLKLLKNSGWIELSCGIIGVVMCHVLNSIIAILFVMLLFSFNLKKFKNRKEFFSLLKVIVSTILITSVFWIPFFIFEMNNSITIPPQTFVISNAKSILSSPLKNHIDASISIFGLLGLLISAFNYKVLTKKSKQFLWIAIIFLAISTNIFPWNLMNGTSITQIVQHTWRFFVIPQLLLSYLFAENIWKIKLANRHNKLFMTFIVMSFIILQLLSQIECINFSDNFSELTNRFNGEGWHIVKNDDEFNILISGYAKGQYDYYPNKSLKYYDMTNKPYAVVNNENEIHTHLLGNGKYAFYNKQNIKHLTLPFLYYNGINYQVKLDGKNVSEYSNKHSLMTINNVSKGNHHLQIIVHKTKAEISSYVLSIIGLIILLGAIIKEYILKRKNK